MLYNEQIFGLTTNMTFKNRCQNAKGCEVNNKTQLIVRNASYKPNGDSTCLFMDEVVMCRNWGQNPQEKDVKANEYKHTQGKKQQNYAKSESGFHFLLS